jgi:murein DD-endopeptidase MepM/ murein hydrolase activator NlpD
MVRLFGGVVLALVLAVGAFAAPSAADRTPGDPAGGHRDGHDYALKAKDAAELARALGVPATPATAQARLAARSLRTVAQTPSSGPDFEMPFRCGTAWTGSTRSSHSPSAYSIDFNAPDDLGKPVLAAAAGTVTLVRSLTYSYGKYVVIDHGGGYSTLYAHLDSLAATVGQRVDQGDLIGYLGTTGGSTGPHLHFEERLNGGWFRPYFSRAHWSFGATAASGNCGDRPAVGDWNSDGVDDVGVWKPRAGKSQFRVLDGATRRNIPWGAAGDTPVLGDFDGDGTTQVGAKLLGSATWKLRSRTGAAATVTGVGGATDVPLAGDWDGNGRAELGWYRWSNRTFYLRGSDLSVRAVTWGGSGEIPVVGDWDGDGVDDLGSFNPTTRVWTLRKPSGSSHVAQRITYGREGDLPVVGDWDGDGVDQLGFWRPAKAVFHRRVTSAPTSRSTHVSFGTWRS